MRPSRPVPLAVLVVTAVLGLLTGAVGVGASRARPAPDGADDTTLTVAASCVEKRAVRLLRAWDRRRARAYAHGDLAALEALYVPRSRTGAVDRAVLRGYVERGLKVTGMRSQVIDA